MTRWYPSRKAELCRAIQEEKPTPETDSFTLSELANMMIKFTLFGEPGLRTTQSND